MEEEMNKTDFLKELRKHLIVLENNEQQDILDEYSQHIDMKIERGLSEEEAIHDFGSISELAAQILEAYHVNPEYEKAGKEKKKLPDLTTFANTGKKAGGSVGHTLHKIGTLLCRGAVRCWNGGILFFRKVCLTIATPFYWAAERIRESRRMRTEKDFIENNLESDSLKSEEHKDRKHDKRNSAGLINSIGHFLLSFCSVIWALFCWGIRWCWNGAVVFICLFSGTAALFSIFSFAVLIVWLIQGYPIAGITVICLGVILSSISFTVLCLSLLKINHHKKTATPVVQELPQEDDHA